MKLIVGLGNPGREYKNTRHNVGFMALDTYLGKVNWKIKMEANFYSTQINDEQVIFIKPLTYMNLSGIAVKKVVDFYNIDVKDILVIQDDLDIDFGNFKVKKNSSSGGHNGIKSIIAELNSEEFGRIKIGIGKSKLIPTDKYVLTKFSKDEIDLLNAKFNDISKIINLFINYGIEKAIQN